MWCRAARTVLLFPNEFTSLPVSGEGGFWALQSYGLVDERNQDFSTLITYLWETTGMTDPPKPIKISETVYGCSECADFKIESVRPGLKSEPQWQQWREREFSDHLKRRHSDPA